MTFVNFKRVWTRLYWRRCMRKPAYRALLIGGALLLLIYYKFSSTSKDNHVKHLILNQDVLHPVWRHDGGLELWRGGNKLTEVDLGRYRTYGDHVACQVDDDQNQRSYLKTDCREWPTYGKITIRQYQHESAVCVDIADRNYRGGQTGHKATQHCIDVSRTWWYGGAANVPEKWPIDLRMSERPQSSISSGAYGSVHDRYWFSNNGIGIMVDDEVPLFVHGDGKKFCLKAYYDEKVFFHTKEFVDLNYTICAKSNVKETHTYMTNRYFRKPIGFPDEKMIKYPVWSTWVKFKSYINQEQTENFLKAIFDNGFAISQLELDDIYTVNYGDYVFDSKKFPNPVAMIKKIHDKGIRLTIWTHPFSNIHTKSYEEGYVSGYFVKDTSGLNTGMARWWRGAEAGVLDATNPKAVEWFKSRLENLRKLGVDGHKYDAGEIGFLPPKFTTHVFLQNPNRYASYYAEAMYNITNNFMQVRVGYKTQHLPIFVSMMDRASSWGNAYGLKSVIPTTLIFGSLGYIFVMPDMIGGNAYCQGNMDCTDQKPDRELYIRWVQLAAFLPMMQFSIPPWDYDEEVVEISRTFVNLHAYYLTPLIIDLAKDAMKTGYPIIRPMWWLAPEDEVAFNIDSQFLVGESLLVAPVLQKGVSTQNIYFPKGTWRDKNTQKKIVVTEPGFHLKNYEVSLDKIPYFERLS